MPNLNELGYTTDQSYKGPQEQVEEKPSKGSLESLGYQVSMKDERIRKELLAEEKEQKTPGPYRGSSFPYVSKIPTSSVIDEKNKRILERKYGNKFDRDEMYGNLPVAFDMSRSDRFDEKKEKFLDYFPKGDIKREKIDGRTVTLIKETPEDKYRLYEDTVLADVVSEETAGAMAGIAAAPFTGGGSLAMAGLTAAGTFAGSQTKYGVETARGYQETPYTDALADSAILAGQAGAIDLATMKAGRLFGLTKPSKLPKGPKTRARAEKAAEKFNYKPLMRGQTTEFPLVPQIFRQAAATTRAVGRKADVQEKQTLDVLRRMTESDFSTVSDDRLTKMVELQKREVENLIDAPGDATPDEFGSTLKEAVDRYSRISGRAKNRLYKKAINRGQDLEFDISSAQDVSEKYLKGTRFKSKKGEEVSKNLDISEGLRDSLKLLNDLDPRISSFRDKTGDVQNPVEQLKELRTQFFDYMTEGSPLERKIASEAWSQLRLSMENPVGGSKQGIELLKRANSANAAREANLQTATIARAIKNEEPGKLLNYFAPKNENTIKTIKNISGKRWQNIKNDFVGTLIQDPASGLSRLKSFQKDKGTLRQIMSEGEERRLKQYLDTVDKIDKGKLSTLSKSQLNRAHRMEQLADEGRERLEETIKYAGGKHSEFSAQARQALIRRAVDNATTLSKDGEQILNSATMNKHLNDLMKSDKYKPLFTDDFKDDIGDTMAYLAKVDRGDRDFGAGLEVAGQAAQAKNILSPLQAIAGWSGAGLNVITANLLSRPNLLRQVTEGPGLMNEKALRAATQVATDVNENLQRVDEEIEDATLDIYKKSMGER